MKMQFWMPAAALALALGATSCKNGGAEADAYGNFEADDIMVSARANGEIIVYNIEEGQKLEAGAVVGRIDSTQLALKREQLRSAIQAIAAKSPAISAQLAVFEKQLAAARQQLATLQREKQRVENLLKSDAATSKQLDDLNAQIEQVQKQIDVILEQKSASDANLSVQKGGLLAEILPLEKQIAQIDDQIAQCRIVNPVAGTVLNNYAANGEVTAFGKPLYKIAKLDPITCRAYVSGTQLGQIKIGQEITVSIDAGNGAMQDFKGTVTWISDKAEFTPKVIQTKEERVNLVYAVKIRVPNDGSLKIGMPAEIRFSQPATAK